MDALKDILKSKKDLVGDMKNRHKYVTKEFQDYGYRIAIKLGEKERASLFIKLAKTKPRAFLEQAYSFAIDYPNARHRGRIFLWKLKELEEEYNKTKKEEKEQQIGMFVEEKSIEKSSKKRKSTKKVTKSKKREATKARKTSDIK